MLENYLLKNLKANEQVIKIIRRYPLTLGWWYLLSVFLIFVAFFLFYPLLRLGWWGLLVFLLLLVTGAAIAVRKYIIWSLDIFLITNCRLIDFDQQGLFNKNVTETNFDNIQDISYNKKGIFATIFDYGNIVVKTASQNSNLEFYQVRFPAKVQELLVDSQNKFSRKNKNIQEET